MSDTSRLHLHPALNFSLSCTPLRSYLLFPLCYEFYLVMDNPQPAGQLPVALPVGGQMGETVSLGVRGGAQLALHHLHPVSHCGLEEEPPTVHTHYTENTYTETHTFRKDFTWLKDIRGGD